jgi:2-phospho-L-lactate guanylyltransferase
VTPPEVEWTVVIPVKRTDLGKSRLAVPAAGRTALARGIALDTIAAACRAARVVVVTADEAIAAEAAQLGAHVVDDPGGGIDAAVAAGAPTGGFRAALLGDLPALRTEDLAAALEDATSVDRGVVADAEGTGTTLVTAAPGVPWATAFGPGSFARHLALGCVPLAVPDASTLRRDVDTVEQLDAAVAHGIGQRTAAALGLASFRVREARPEDVPAMARVHVQSWQQTYRGLFPDAILDDPGFVERRERMWTNALSDRSGRARVAVAETGGEIVGIALSGPSEAADAERQLNVLYLLAAHQGRGAGSALLEAVVAAEDDVILWVADPNPRAQAFYRKHGFAPDGPAKVEMNVREIRMRRRPA